MLNYDRCPKCTSSFTSPCPCFYQKCGLNDLWPCAYGKCIVFKVILCFCCCCFPLTKVSLSFLKKRYSILRCSNSKIYSCMCHHHSCLAVPRFWGVMKVAKAAITDSVQSAFHHLLVVEGILQW